MLQHSELESSVLVQLLQAQRRYTLDYLSRLSASEWIGPAAPQLNPPLWEWLHLVWFQEYWCLRYRGEHMPALPSRLDDADNRLDSSVLSHDNRWLTRLPSISQSLEYAEQVLLDVIAKISAEQHHPYFCELALYHESMHEENFMRHAQSLQQAFRAVPSHSLGQSVLIDLPAQTVELAPPEAKVFAFDNEKGQQCVVIESVQIMNRPITEWEYSLFVAADGYQQSAFWSEKGWQWRAASNAEHPVYWQRHNGQWRTREFTTWRPLHMDQAMRYLNVHEAEAYARWRGARLPSSAEWFAACHDARFIIAPLWEWMNHSFAAYQGFAADPYLDYSRTSFGSHQELRGHSPLQHVGLCRPRFRNFYLPDRRDVSAGFRLVFVA